MTKVGERSAVEADARVNLLSVILARIPEGELAIGANLRLPGSQDRIRHDRVAVLDHHVRDPPAPDDVPGAKAIALECSLDARLRERRQHPAVELAVSVDRHRARRRAERRHDSGEHTVAFLPVEARDVERHLRALPERGASLELHVRALGGRPAVIEDDPVRIERIDDVSGDRLVSERQMGVEGTGQLRQIGDPGDDVCLELARHRLDARRRLQGDLATPRFERPLSERPLEPVLARGAAGEPQTLHFEKVREP